MGLISYMLLNFLRLRLTWIPNKSPPQVRVPSTLVHSPRAEAFSNTSTLITKDPHLYRTCTAVYALKRDMLAWNLRQEDFRYRDQTALVWAGHRHEPLALIPLVRGKLGRSHKEWELSQHIREWRYLQPKTLRY